VTKTGKTVAVRTARFRKWVADTYKGKVTSNLTTRVVADQATAELGFQVSQNRAARELYRQGISFRRLPGDPPEPRWSLNELNRARLDRLEERVRLLESEVLGRAKPAFIPRSNRTLSKPLKPAAAQE
jgi:hypothetical protein